jgi:hypothetical protein
VDYFQGVVADYLRADRAVFVNTECCIQLNPGANPDTSGSHWYCDAVAVNLRDRAVFLCEVTYSKTLDALINRLSGWNQNWSLVLAALVRDLSVPAEWPVRPWLFIPEERNALLEQKLASFRVPSDDSTRMPRPKVTFLEAITPWKYNSWNRQPDKRNGDA